MNDIQKAILEARSKQRELITKGFEPQDDSTIEKAKWNPGDIHPNGKWVFTEYKPGKFDWRNRKGGSAGSSDESKTSETVTNKEDNLSKFLSLAKKSVIDNKDNSPWEIPSNDINEGIKRFAKQQNLTDSEVSGLISRGVIKTGFEKKKNMGFTSIKFDSKKLQAELNSSGAQSKPANVLTKGSYVTYEVANIPHMGRVVSVDKDGKYANVRTTTGDLKSVSISKLKSADGLEKGWIERKMKERKYADGKTYNAEFEDSESTSDSKAEEQKKIEDKKGEKLNSLMEKYDGLPEKIKDNYKKVLSSIQEEGSKFYNFIKDLNDTSSGKLFIRPSDTRNSLEIMEVSSSFYSRQDGDAGDRKVESAFSNFDKVLKKHGVKTSVEYETAAGSYGGKGYISLDELKKLTSK